MGHGLSRRRRRLEGVEVKPLIAKIKVEKYERLEQIADARGVSIVSCVDEMIEADWQKRTKQVVPRETVL